MLSDFTFNGTNSTEFGLYIKNKSVHKSAARKLSFEFVPGRDGDIIQDEGGYENIEITYNVRTPEYVSKIDDIANWLSPITYCRLLDSDDASKYRLGVCTSGVEWEHAGQGFGDCSLTFNCKPYRYLISGQDTVTLTAAGTLTNPTSYKSLPYIKITGSGNVTLAINSNSYLLTSISPNIEIDSEMMNVYRGTTLLNSKASFDEFPVLSPGSNSISWTGTVTKVEIIPRWRCL